MRRFFRFSLFFLLFISTFGTSPFIASAFTVREELLFSVVQLVTVGESGDVFLGSGSTIRSDGLLLTNRHVVIDSETEEVFSHITLCYSVSQHQPPRCSATGKVLAVNEDLDLAIVLPDKRIAKNGSVTDISFQKYWKKLGKKFYTVPFKNSYLSALPNILDRVTVWGYPVLGGSTVTVTSGYVSGFSVSDLTDEDSFVSFIKTDTEISAGNSGGAAFNDSFAFIGVPTRAHPGELGFIVPTQSVVEWLASLEKEKILTLASLESLQTYSSAFSDIVEDSSLHDIALFLRHFGIMKGFEDSTFRPQAFVTRDEAMKIMYAARGFTNLPKISRPEKFITQKEFFDLFQQVFHVWKDAPNPSSLVTRGQAASTIFDFVRN